MGYFIAGGLTAPVAAGSLASGVQTSLGKADTAIQAIMIDWLLPSGDGKARKDGDNAAAIGLIHLIRQRNENIPIFLLCDRDKARALTADIIEAIDELVLLVEDSATFVAGRVHAAMRLYVPKLF